MNFDFIHPETLKLVSAGIESRMTWEPKYSAFGGLDYSSPPVEISGLQMHVGGAIPRMLSRRGEMTHRRLGKRVRSKVVVWAIYYNITGIAGDGPFEVDEIVGDFGQLEDDWAVLKAQVVKWKLFENQRAARTIS